MIILVIIKSSIPLIIYYKIKNISHGMSHILEIKNYSFENVSITLIWRPSIKKVTNLIVNFYKLLNSTSFIFLIFSGSV